jgi:hypothetical protein
MYSSIYCDEDADAKGVTLLWLQYGTSTIEFTNEK